MIKIITLISTLFMAMVSSAQAASITVQPLAKDQYLSYNFGSVPVNMRVFADFSLTAGEEQVEIKRITIRGMDFDVATDCPVILAPRQRCWTRVFFWPRFQGSAFGDLNFYLHDSTIYVRLYGSSHN